MKALLDVCLSGKNIRLLQTWKIYVIASNRKMYVM